MNRKSAHGKACPYCQRQMDLHSNRLQPTRDHVVPQARGGRAIIICCLQCNGIKGDMMPSAWDAFMAAHPRWWTLSKYDLRAIWRAPRAAARDIKWGPRKPPRQGTAPMPPVVVPPELIYEANKLPPYQRSQVLLQAYRDAKALEDAYGSKADSSSANAALQRADSEPPNIASGSA